MLGKALMGDNRAQISAILFVPVIIILGLALLAFDIFSRPKGLLGQLNLDYVIVDLQDGDYEITPELASGGYSEEDFSSMVSRLKPYAAITGTYYDPAGKPIGDLVVKGKLICRGYQRQGIGFTRHGKIKFLERKGHARINWHGCYSGIACGPRLVRAGKIDVNVKRDGFKNGAAVNEARRCAVGATKDGKLILCAVRDYITLDTMAKVMLELGARDAINLDGGSMCALYKDGNISAHPMKPMSNVLAVYRWK